MVVGAGRGPLVRRALAAAKRAQARLKVYAVEKNPNAVVTLQAQQDEDWGPKVGLGLRGFTSVFVWMYVSMIFFIGGNCLGKEVCKFKLSNT